MPIRVAERMLDKILIWKNIHGKDYCIRVPADHIMNIAPEPSGKVSVTFRGYITREGIDEIKEVPVALNEIHAPTSLTIQEFVHQINQLNLYLPSEILKYLEERTIAIRSGLIGVIISNFFAENGFAELVPDQDYIVRSSPDGRVVSLEFISAAGKKIALDHGFAHRNHTFVL